MIISEADQNTDAWIQERLGKPSASCFKEIVTTNGGRSKSRTKYLYRLAGEQISGEQYKGFYSKDMELGHEREDEARRQYGFRNGVTVQEVGFCYYDERRLFGASPDGLVGDFGGFENKNAAPHIQIERLEEGWSGKEHYQQVQGALFVLGREWWDLNSYCRGMEPVTVRFDRDEEFIKALHHELLIFCSDLEEMVVRNRRNEYITVIEPEALPEKTYPIFDEIEALRDQDPELIKQLEEKHDKPTHPRQAAMIVREFNKQKGIN